MFLRVYLCCRCLAALDVKDEMNKQKRKTNYGAFFIFGIVFVVLGIGLMSAVGPPGFVFLVVGLASMTMGLVNRGKWAESKKETI